MKMKKIVFAQAYEGDPIEYESVSGWGRAEYPGLAAAQCVRGQGNHVAWSVYHTPSGYRVGGTWGKRETALAVLDKIGDLIDWTVEREKLDLDKLASAIDARLGRSTPA